MLGCRDRARARATRRGGRRAIRTHADAAPYALAWSERVAADTDHLLWTNDLAVSTSPTAGLEARASADGHVAWTKSRREDSRR